MGLARGVDIVGVGMIKFGELFEKSYEDMMFEAYRNALQDAGAEPKDIEAAWIGTYGAGQWIPGGNTGAALTDPLRLYPKPCTRVENACATGSDAFRNAVFGVASGAYDVVLAVGAEKMRDIGPRDSLIALAEQGRHPVWATGLTAPGYFALYATRHMKEYGTKKEQMGLVSVKNHHNGTMDPYAHFQYEVTLDKVIRAPIVASPFGVFDCCPTTDGAAAVIIAASDRAKRFTDTPVHIAGLGQGTDTLWFSQKETYTSFTATVEAGREAYKMAGVTPKDINVAEVHDCFTFTEILNYEDLGFCPPGQGGKFIEEGCSTLDGDLPVNPSGGLKSKGHPIGATGCAQLCEITWHLRGEAGKRQVRGAETGLAHNLGGAGQVSNVSILKI